MTQALLPEILSGQLLPVELIANRRTGKRPSRATVWRWIKRGVSGGKLDAAFHGQWMTTTEAFDDFLARQTEAMMEPRETVPPASDEDLLAAGLL